MKRKASPSDEQHAEWRVKKSPSCLTFPLRAHLSLPTVHLVSRYFVIYWQEPKWYLTMQPIKHATEVIFLSGLPYIQLWWCCSFAACLQSHPGFGDCSNTHVTSHILYFCVESYGTISPLQDTYASTLSIFSCYEYNVASHWRHRKKARP